MKKIQFADRMSTVKKSFIREILKVTIGQDDIISFAGGLPNPTTFPVENIENATKKILEEDGARALQYSSTEGYFPLRQYIAERYMKTRGLKVDPEEIIITNGAQQGLDLVGKILVNKGSSVAIESPGYLGAIQAFSIYEPRFHTIPLEEDGPNVDVLEDSLKNNDVAFFYGVPNFQNPTGITYSEEKRRRIASIFQQGNTLFVEDDPYGELRFMGQHMSSMKTYLPEQTVMLGSFSKIVAPAMRLGWICASKEIVEKLIIAKQAADLHTNYFAQRIVYQHLKDNSLDEHIGKISRLYKSQRDSMVDAIEQYFPKEVSYTKPEGGMFLWVTLPENISALDLFDISAKKGVVFVPGDPFYVGRTGANTLRLNYTNSNEETIRDGIKRLAEAIDSLL